MEFPARARDGHMSGGQEEFSPAIVLEEDVAVEPPQLMVEEHPLSQPHAATFSSNLLP